MKRHGLKLCGFTVMLILASPAWAVDININLGGVLGSDGGGSAQPAKNGPPDHAPAHGYRAKHQYKYYPSSEVYFDPARALYFFLSGSQWKVSASLPDPLKLHLGGSVSIEMDSDKPYTHHAEHKKKYPPGQSKNKAKPQKASQQKQDKGKGSKNK